MVSLKKTDIISRLQTDILRLQGFKTSNSSPVDFGLGTISDAFPNRTFPLGAVHEFLSNLPEDAAATGGFITALLSPMLKMNSGVIVWIGKSRTVFPPALKSFGIQPDRCIFLDLQNERDVLWAMDETLKCNAITAVICELREISFTASRRLQLAVERSNVTGFIVLNNNKKLTTTACVSRWRITSIPSKQIDGLPGVGFPTWKVELLRMRNGKVGVWHIQWKEGRFIHLDTNQAIEQLLYERKAGS
jgi:protein ImuA